MEFWIVGKVIDLKHNGWAFQGIYDDEQKAVANCRTEKYFIGKAMLNNSLPDKDEVWPGAYYPLAK
jgi:hypothetical protein